MDELRSANGGGRKLEIVKGNVFSANQIYMSRPRSPDRQQPPPVPDRETKVGKSSSAKTKSSSWSFNDPEMKRRKRVAKYKVYAVEGRVKASIRKGIRWIKNKCYEIVNGF